ncbi:MAG TPA: aminoacyl-tRNA hydrolase [Ktedonobacterales bacterium]|nr:aminoacyl-tRNA hydrolase [Ktedonobacterales bacterium]
MWTTVKLIVGLGNPGARYARTRHNVGFDVVDLIASRQGWSWQSQRGRTQVASGALRYQVAAPAPDAAPDAAPDTAPDATPAAPPIWREEKLLLAKPQTYMNESGMAVSELVRFYKLNLRDLLVVCDDLDLPLARLRLRTRGAAGGQHGLESTIRLLGTNAFARLKIGIGRPTHGRDENVDFLLSAPRGEERVELDTTIAIAADAALAWVTDGAEAAMNRFNR